MTNREKSNKLQSKAEEISSVANQHKNIETNVKRVVQTLYSVVNSVRNQISVLFGETLLPTTFNFVLNVDQNKLKLQKTQKIEENTRKTNKIVKLKKQF